MLPSCVIRKSHSPRPPSPVSRQSAAVVFSNFRLSTFDSQPPLLRNSHRIISFADPHPLTPLQSHLYKNRGGATLPVSAHHPLPITALTPLDSTHTRHLVCVANKGLTESLTSLESALTKTIGSGIVMVNRIPGTGISPVRPALIRNSSAACLLAANSRGRAQDSLASRPHYLVTSLLR